MQMKIIALAIRGLLRDPYAEPDHWKCLRLGLQAESVRVRDGR